VGRRRAVRGTLPHAEEADRVRHALPLSSHSSSSIDAGIAHVPRQPVMPALERCDGYTGFVPVWSTGRPADVLLPAPWQSEGGDAARARKSIRPVRDRCRGGFSVAAETSRNGRSLSCTRDHRSNDGAWCASQPGSRSAPDQIDRGIDFYKTTILPALEELDGFLQCQPAASTERPVVAWPRRPFDKR